MESISLFCHFCSVVHNPWWYLRFVQIVKKILSVLFFLVFSNSTFADDKMALGLEVYNKKAQCGVCHTLQAAGSKGDIGPNLDLIKPQEVQIFNAVSNGIGVMQAWKGVLTDEEIEAVAYYVFNSTNK